MKNIRLTLTAVAAFCIVNFAVAQDRPQLHVDTRWRECSIVLDPSLTQEAWHQFTREAGLVTYFRSLTDAKPMGPGRFEIAVLKWDTRINEADAAWNDTFVHPYSEHWLIDGKYLPFPGLTVRAGISKRIDAGVFWGERPGANYGVIGAQFQYNLLNDTAKNWAVSARASFNSLYGPSDLNLTVYGVDLLASKSFTIISKWTYVSPYTGISTYLSHAHEKTEAVNLKDENIFGVQAMAGAVVQIKIVRLGIEYNFAHVNTFSLKVGVNFKI